VTPLEEKMAELGLRFAQHAGAELASLDAALASDDRQAVLEQAHSLAGISAMFGFKDIGKAAAALEDAALAHRDLPSSAEPLRALLAALADPS
jgi:HPt (histidine-containing phosphotransfer) domain-containing protein